MSRENIDEISSLNDVPAAEWDRLFRSRGVPKFKATKDHDGNQIKSDGGSSSYYFLPKGCVDLDDIIVKKNMPWHIANIFKACYRYGEKAGHDELYDANKILWFIQRELEHLQETR